MVSVTPDRYVNKGPGRADNGNFVLSELKLAINDKPVELSAVNCAAVDMDQSGDSTHESSITKI